MEKEMESVYEKKKTEEIFFTTNYLMYLAFESYLSSHVNPINLIILYITF